MKLLWFPHIFVGDVNTFFFSALKTRRGKKVGLKLNFDTGTFVLFFFIFYKGERVSARHGPSLSVDGADGGCHSNWGLCSRGGEWSGLRVLELQRGRYKSQACVWSILFGDTEPVNHCAFEAMSYGSWMKRSNPRHFRETVLEQLKHTLSSFSWFIQDVLLFHKLKPDGVTLRFQLRAWMWPQCAVWPEF